MSKEQYAPLTASYQKQQSYANDTLIKKYSITYLLTINYSFLELCFMVKHASIYELAAKQLR